MLLHSPLNSGVAVVINQFGPLIGLVLICSALTKSLFTILLFLVLMLMLVKAILLLQSITQISYSPG
jgi:hypothetical protein